MRTLTRGSTRFPRVAVRPITFLSDYGEADGFAGVCRAVIARIAPRAFVIDLTHGIARHDVRQGAEVLANSTPFAAPGVHLAIVDPGVGSQRRALAVATVDEGRHFVGPDNGLLSTAVARFGGASDAVEISSSPARLEPVSETFHGRDIFAPVAAHLALGEPLASLGNAIDPGSLHQLELEAPDVEPGFRLTAEVGHVDGFGNATLIATPADADIAGLRVGERLRVRAPGRSGEAVYARTFAEVAADEMLVYVGASGSLALAVNRGNAALVLDLCTGDRVALTVM